MLVVLVEQTHGIRFAAVDEQRMAHLTALNSLLVAIHVTLGIASD